MRKVTFIINPVSGVFKKGKISGLIDLYLDKSKFEYEIEFTEGPGHATEICKSRVGKGVDIVVAVGGDGSINEVAKGLVGSNSKLGIIPAGSGNGLAHHLKIPGNYRKAIEVINHERAIKIDTGTINDKLFVSIAGIGFDGLVAKKFVNNKLRGFLAYAKIVAEEYPKYKPKKYKIDIDGKIIKKRALFITFANSDRFGYFTSIAPNARVDDGLLDIIIAEKPLIIEIPILTHLLYWRKIDKSKRIEVIKAKELIVRSKKKRWVNIDGEPFKLSKELHVKIHPQSLNIIVP